MALTTTFDQLYIVELTSPFERLQIQFMPDFLQWNRTANISSIKVVGRNNPLKHYTGGEDTLNFKLMFYSDEENREDVIRKIRWLKSLAMNDGGFGPVRNVKLVWGSLFRREVWVVNSINSKMSNFHHEHGMLPIRAEIDIKMSLDPKKNLRLSDVRI